MLNIKSHDVFKLIGKVHKPLSMVSTKHIQNCLPNRKNLNLLTKYCPAYNLRPRRPPFLLVASDGIGVTSSMRPIFIEERANARRADCAPGPGVLVLLPPVARSLM